MKICLLGNAASIHLVRWANGLDSLGHEVYLLSADRPGIHQINQKVNLVVLPFRPPLGYYLNSLSARRILNQIKPDILNTHYASGYGTLSRLIDFHPILLSVWGSDVFEVPYRSRSKKQLVLKNLQRADRIASTSKAMKLQVEKLYSPAKEIFVTPFGVDLCLFYPKKKEESQKIVIGIIKTIDNKYGQIYLVQSFRLLLDRLESEGKGDIVHSLRLYIIGGGPKIKLIRQLVQKLELGSYAWLPGEIPHSAVSDYLNQFDIACFPSLSDSFGVSVIEASACEIPVVASNIGGLPEVVIDNQTGFLVEPKNVQVLTERLYQLVLNQKLRQNMGKAGRKFVSENYEWNENLQRMEEYMIQVITEYQNNKYG